MSQGDRDFLLVVAGGQLSSQFLPIQEVMYGDEVARNYTPHFLKSVDSYLRCYTKLMDTNLQELREAVGRIRRAAALN